MAAQGRIGRVCARASSAAAISGAAAEGAGRCSFPAAAQRFSFREASPHGARVRTCGSSQGDQAVAACHRRPRSLECASSHWPRSAKIRPDVNKRSPCCGDVDLKSAPPRTTSGPEQDRPELAGLGDSVSSSTDIGREGPRTRPNATRTKRKSRRGVGRVGTKVGVCEDRSVAQISKAVGSRSDSWLKLFG
jgi:hypothetical protein